MTPNDLALDIVRVLSDGTPTPKQKQDIETCWDALQRAVLALASLQAAGFGSDSVNSEALAAGFLDALERGRSDPDRFKVGVKAAH